MLIGILWPTFALVALIYGVFGVMFWQRGRHSSAHPARAGDFATREAAARYFQPVELSGNNFSNLFEMPVLYFALVPLLLVTRHGDHIEVMLAWAYVVLRAIHSIIHIGPNSLKPRAGAFVLSAFVLLAMWVWFFIGMLGAAAALSGGA